MKTETGWQNDVGGNGQTRVGYRPGEPPGKLALAAMALLLLSPLCAGAGGVVTNCTEAALRAAIAGGGTVTFDCDGTITLASTITVGVNLTLDGSGHQVTISGQNSVQLLYVATNVQLTVLKLGFADGLSMTGGALFNAGGTVSATNCVFTGNRAIGADGSQGGNGGIGAGGAVYNEGSFIASQCAFVLNTAQGGRGADGDPYQEYEPGNGGGGEGGALCNVGVAILGRSLFASNSAAGGSGGAGSSGYWISATGGGAGRDGAGGALYNASAATLINCTLADNRGVGGNGGAGGLHNWIVGAPKCPWHLWRGGRRWHRRNL